MMKQFKKGDRVKFLNETGGGEVRALSGRDMVIVVTDDGFEYPVPVSELIHSGTLPTDRDEPPMAELPEDKPAVSPEPPAARAKVKPARTAGTEEIDLHIGEIIDDWSGLSSGEIVEIQLARFRTTLEGAVRSGQGRIVFIHGRGAGKLKYEIEKILKRDFPGCRYQDASFREYGYGATIVFLR